MSLSWVLGLASPIDPLSLMVIGGNFLVWTGATYAALFPFSAIGRALFRSPGGSFRLLPAATGNGRTRGRRSIELARQVIVEGEKFEQIVPFGIERGVVGRAPHSLGSI